MSKVSTNYYRKGTEITKVWELLDKKPNNKNTEYKIWFMEFAYFLKYDGVQAAMKKYKDCPFVEATASPIYWAVKKGKIPVMIDVESRLGMIQASLFDETA